MKDKYMNTEKNDDEIWDELLSSEDGKLALDYLLNNANFEEATDKTSELNTDSLKKLKKK